MTRVAIMQPAYLPWSGYFGLMQSVDLFIFLDSVQFARRSWQQRNQIKTATGPQWLTVPVLVKGKRDQLISQVEIDMAAGFDVAHCRALKFNYCQANHYQPYVDAIVALIEDPPPLLADLTIGCIEGMAQMLNIDTPTIRSSTLNNIGTKADLLASICQQVDATEYVSPPGSREYLEASDAFEKIGVPVRYFGYQHPVYHQPFGDFLPYMSSLDMLFNCGEQSKLLIENGCKVSK